MRLDRREESARSLVGAASVANCSLSGDSSWARPVVKTSNPATKVACHRGKTRAFIAPRLTPMESNVSNDYGEMSAATPAALGFAHFSVLIESE
jgi:hypothetical protein